MKLALIAAVAAASISFAPVRSLIQAPPQDKPADAKPDEGKRKWPWGTEEEAERIREGMVGTWRLVSVRRSAATYEGEMCQGVMLVAAEHLSMQVRVLAPTGALQGTFIEGFSAGTYKWTYDLTRLKVVIHTAMAVSNFSGADEWEPPGTQREYEVLVNEDQLTLTRPGEAEFIFARVRPTLAPKPKAPR